MNLDKKVSSEDFLSTICTHADEVLSLINKYSTINGQFSEDLRSDIYLYLLEHAGHRYNESTNISTFCVEVAKQYARNAYNSHKREEKFLRQFRKIHLKKRQAYQERSQNIDQVCQIINEEKNPELKEILSRRFINNESLADIAFDLKTSINNIVSQIDGFIEKQKENFKCH